MRPPGPTFWLLDGPTGWRTADGRGVTAAATGLRLTVAPGGPLALGAPDGSLGRLVLPSGIAVDGQARTYLLAPEPPWLRRFTPGVDAFEPLPAAGEAGDDARHLRAPVALAAAGRDLLVADRGSRRVQVFDSRTLALRRVWGPRDERGRTVPDDHPDAWDPIDVAATPRAAFILDGRHGLVFRRLAPSWELAPVIPEGTRHGRWSRLVVDREGRLYLLDPATERLHVFTTDGAALATVADPEEVRDRFAAPPATIDHAGLIQLRSELTEPCPRDPQTLPRPDEDPLFDAHGARRDPDPDAWVGPPTHLRRGTWVSEPLDSGIHRCQWHRIVLDAALPSGASLRVSTYTDGEERPRAEIAALPDGRWTTSTVVAGGGDGAAAIPADLAVRSREGRYLWLRLELSGDGYGTPAVAGIRAHYPRQTYLEHLPAVYSSDDPSRRFLERFLAIFQTQLESVEGTIRDVAGLFDPAAAPAAMVDVLAGWLALPPETGWGTAERRRLVAAVPAALRRRGTPRALRSYLRAHLENLTGNSLHERHFPHLVEGFRERHHVWLSSTDQTRRAELWSRGKVARLQLDRYAAEGEVRLVSTGDPDRDVFHHYAHTFRVLVPAAWVRTRADEDVVRRAVEAEKPAHTTYRLELVAPRLRVGVQSTVGLNTIIGDYPVARLACSHDTDAAPSSPPRSRLGADTVLCAGPDRTRDLRIGPDNRVGANATLI